MEYYTMNEIVDMLNEHDCFALEKQGFRYGDKDTDKDTLNAYLEDSTGWFAHLRCV